MEWLKQMQAAIDYMEEHMEERITIEEIARAGCSSPFHFQRMFYMLTGVTVGEYMRRRRLTLAAQELAGSASKVLDVALKYGYDSPESFAKAFRKLHGIPPSQARAEGVKLKAYPRITFQILLKGDKEMDYQIIDKPAFKAAGIVIETTMEDGQNKKDITKFWADSQLNGDVARIISLLGAEELYGIIYGIVPGQDTFNYMIGGRLDGDEVPEGLTAIEIPASRWAVFTAVGPLPGSIQSLFNRIFQEWFPATGYEHAHAPELEVYFPGDIHSEDYRCEVWVPIVKPDA
jgi:AraC family transcriptional regulator